MPSMELSLSILLYLVHVVVDCNVGPKHSSPLPCRIIYPGLLPRALRCLLGRGGTLSCPAAIKVGHVTCSSQCDMCTLRECVSSKYKLQETLYISVNSLSLYCESVPDRSSSFHLLSLHSGKIRESTCKENKTVNLYCKSLNLGILFYCDLALKKQINLYVV